MACAGSGFFGDGALVHVNDEPPRRAGLVVAVPDHEDDPERAVRAALAIRQRTVELNEEHAGVFPSVALHMGINTGEAWVGATKIGGAGSQRWTFTATGPTTNLAARFAGSGSHLDDMKLVVEIAREACAFNGALVLDAADEIGLAVMATTFAIVAVFATVAAASCSGSSSSSPGSSWPTSCPTSRASPMPSSSARRRSRPTPRSSAGASHWRSHVLLALAIGGLVGRPIGNAHIQPLYPDASAY